MAEVDIQEQGLTGALRPASHSPVPYPARRLVLAEIPASALTSTVTKIEASDNQIQEVKADIAGAANLEELLLYKNKIKTVDPAIGQLKKLKVLNLFNQGVLAKLPWPELGGLGALEELNLAANKIMMIPDAAFAGLSSLKILSINDNRLVRLGSLTPLTSLEELRLYNNNLEEMPAVDAANLTIVELNKNRITSIPSDYFVKTPALERLVMPGCMLEAVPASLATCANLQILQLQDNKLTAFEEEATWDKLTKLKTVFLQGNPGLTVPISLGLCRGLTRINAPTANDELAETFKKLALASPDGIYWGSDGAAQKASK
jgi:Leucine-rich repeat (LRR) protein